MCFYVICSNNKNNNKNGSRLKLLKNFLRGNKIQKFTFFEERQTCFQK